MSKIAVVYWSGTGNTEMMAQYVVQGIHESGSNADLMTSAEFHAGMINDYDGIAFGCPSMGAEQLEESEFGPMFETCQDHLLGKSIALFGSYGWGDGEWMRLWEATCVDAGAHIVGDSLICCGAVDLEGQNACIDLGKALCV